MSIARVVRVLLVIGVVLGPIAATSVWHARRIGAAAEQYRREVLVVTGSSCIGGTRNERGGPSSTSPEHCFLAGTIGGVAEELSADRPSIARYPPGSEVAVWYAPALEPFGINYQPLRVLWDLGEDPADEARGTERAWLSLLGMLAFWVVVFEVHHALSVRPFWRFADPAVLVVADDGIAPGIGIGLAAVGASLLSWQVVAAPAIGGIVVGAFLLAIAIPLGLRRVHEVDRTEGELRARRSFWPWHVRRSRVALATPPSVRLHLDHPGAEATLSVATADGDARLFGAHDLDRVHARGVELARLLGVELDAAWPDDPETGAPYDLARDRALATAGRRARWRGRAAPVIKLAIVLGLGALALTVPAVTTPIARRALEPDLLATPDALRVWALRRLATRQDEASLLVALRVANTADPAGAPFGEALRALEAMAGRAFDGDDPTARVRAANGWAAERLGRALDAHGGVLAWYPVTGHFHDTIEQIASGDPRDAWLFWSSFGPGDMPNSRVFAATVGAALADSRPISFAIRRGSFLTGPGPDAPPFEGQPEPIADHAGEVLVDTVGGALALRMWLYDDVPGAALPDDFIAWWDAYGRTRLLPPVPRGASLVEQELP